MSVLFGAMTLTPMVGCGPATTPHVEKAPIESPTDKVTVVDDPDQDQIVGDADACPNDAEDLDGFEDADGCPELDNDNDLIADLEDECPNEPEIPNGIDDEDGCPDMAPVVPVYGSPAIAILDKVYFDSGSSVVVPNANRLLTDIARVLVENPQLRVVIEGHCDSTEAGKERLSETRAKIVLDILVSHGVDPQSLRAAGRGDTMPLDTNSTADGRAMNRRVDFVVTEAP